MIPDLLWYLSLRVRFNLLFLFSVVLALVLAINTLPWEDWDPHFREENPEPEPSPPPPPPPPPAKFTEPDEAREKLIAKVTILLFFLAHILLHEVVEHFFGENIWERIFGDDVLVIGDDDSDSDSDSDEDEE